MSDTHRKVRLAVEEEVLKHGASVSFRSGAKHTLLVVEVGDQYRQVSFARKSSKPTKVDNQMDWARQNIRRLVKEIQCDTSKLSPQ